MTNPENTVSGRLHGVPRRETGHPDSAHQTVFSMCRIAGRYPLSSTPVSRSGTFTGDNGRVHPVQSPCHNQFVKAMCKIARHENRDQWRLRMAHRPRRRRRRPPWRGNAFGGHVDGACEFTCLASYSSLSSTASRFMINEQAFSTGCIEAGDSLQDKAVSPVS